jgi:hypothetical protein
MNPIIVVAIINVAGLIIVAVINLVAGRSRNAPAREPISAEGERPPTASPGRTRNGTGRSRAVGRKSARDRLRAVTRTLGVVFFVGLVVSGIVWRHQRFVADQSQFRIDITTVPPAGAGGPDRIEPIGGTVKGAVPAGARVVVYAYAGGQWFVQPDTQFPLTLIADHAWATSTRLGAQYAALLVGPGFIAPSVSTALPVGANVLAVAQSAGR